jgi:hypothetical protein
MGVLLPIKIQQEPLPAVLTFHCLSYIQYNSFALDDVSVFDGNYVVTANAWANYAPGDIIPLEFVSEYAFRILSTNNDWIENNLTSYMEVTINPADESAVVSSNECFETNRDGGCLDVTGADSAGTCAGDVNLIVDYGEYTDNAFSLVKQ